MRMCWWIWPGCQYFRPSEDTLRNCREVWRVIRQCCCIGWELMRRVSMRGFCSSSGQTGSANQWQHCGSDILFTTFLGLPLFSRLVKQVVFQHRDGWRRCWMVVTTKTNVKCIRSLKTCIFTADNETKEPARFFISDVGWFDWLMCRLLNDVDVAPSVL
jgi:hypothetical protein